MPAAPAAVASSPAATPRSLSYLEDGGGKIPVVPPSKGSRKRKGMSSTPRSTSKRRTMPKSMPAISPTFAMIAQEWYKGHENLLAIGHDAGTWDFKLKSHLSTIREKHVQTITSTWWDIGMRSDLSSPASMNSLRSTSRCLPCIPCQKVQRHPIV